MSSTALPKVALRRPPKKGAFTLASRESRAESAEGHDEIGEALKSLPKVSPTCEVARQRFSIASKAVAVLTRRAISSVANPSRAASGTIAKNDMTKVTVAVREEEGVSFVESQTISEAPSSRD